MVLELQTVRDCETGLWAGSRVLWLQLWESWFTEKVLLPAVHRLKWKGTDTQSTLMPFLVFDTKPTHLTIWGRHQQTPGLQREFMSELRMFSLTVRDDAQLPQTKAEKWFSPRL